MCVTVSDDNNIQKGGSMTQNQINYQRHKEDVRTHQAQEAESERSHRESERIAQLQYEEAKRANQARESEAYRANTTQEKETNRSNLARELETNRANLVKEQLTKYQVDTSARTAKYQTDVNADTSRYASDQNYQSRVDAAYINKHGVDPTTIKKGAAKVAETFVKVGRTPQIAVPATKATAGLYVGLKGIQGMVEGKYTPLGGVKSKSSPTTKSKTKQKGAK